MQRPSSRSGSTRYSSPKVTAPAWINSSAPAISPPICACITGCAMLCPSMEKIAEQSCHQGCHSLPLRGQRGRSLTRPLPSTLGPWLSGSRTRCGQELVPRPGEVAARSIRVHEKLFLSVPLTPGQFVVRLDAVAVRVVEIDAQGNTVVRHMV